MTKKHFIALADVLKSTRPIREVEPDAADQWELMKNKLADFCKSENPHFDRSRWMGYIAGDNGPSGGAVKK